MTIIGIDPGPTKSGYVVCDIEGAKIAFRNAISEFENGKLLEVVRLIATLCPAAVAIESPEALYAGAGRETINTIRFVGRLEEAMRDMEVVLLSPQRVRMLVCGTAKAKDSGVRAALIDRFGPVGTKKQPGPLCGVSGHAWRALAVAVAEYDRRTA